MHTAEEMRADEPRIGEVVPAERRLAETRAEIEDLLIPQPGEFPRSETMRFIMGRNGKYILAGAAVALVAIKPRFAATLLGLLPSAVRLLPVHRILHRLL